jgi:hypothetical protein
MEKNQKKAKVPKTRNHGSIRPKESTLNKKVVDWLNSLPRCCAYKRKGGPANPGQLDVTGCLRGIRIEIEGKIEPNKPTRLQKHYIKKWAEAGAITGWYTSLEGAQDLVRKGIGYWNIKI